jgi:hypothetical protein
MIQLKVQRSYCPPEPAVYLSKRGWTQHADGTMSNMSRNAGARTEWSEALIYEMFMHLNALKNEG